MKYIVKNYSDRILFARLCMSSDYYLVCKNKKKQQQYTFMMNVLGNS